MQALLWFPLGVDLSVVKNEYPDIVCENVGDGIECWVGNSSDDIDEEDEDLGERLSYEGAVVCCAFVEGAIPDAETLVEGNGPWAQGMLRRRDFSGYSASEEERRDLKRISDLWWASYERGQATASAH